MPELTPLGPATRNELQADTEAQFVYPGVETLEAMAEAVNYNGFLLGLVAAHATLQDDILDFGAGTGLLAQPLSAAGYRVACVEPDNELRARLRAARCAAHASLDTLPQQYFDVIYTFNVVEHIADDASAVAALAARLKPGGRLLVYVPAFQLLYGSMDRQVGHFRRYRKAGLRQLLASAGLAVNSVRYMDSLGFFAALLFRFVGNDRGEVNRRALVVFDRCVFPLSRRLDRVTGGWFGKNLFAVASRRD